MEVWDELPTGQENEHDKAQNACAPLEYPHYR